MKQFIINSFSGLRREVWLLSILMLINRAGMMVVPFLGLYLLEELNFTKTHAGIVGFCFGAGALLGSYLGGYLSDKVGTYKVMLWSLTGGAIGLWGLGMFDNFYLISAWIFLTAVIGDMVRPAVFTALADYTDDSNLTRGISLVRMAINLGIAIGPAVGGFMIHAYGYQWIFILDGSTCLLAAVFLFLALGHIRDHKKEFTAQDILDARSPYRDSAFIIFMIFNLLILVGFFQILNTTPVFIKEVYALTEAHIGWFFTANGLIIFFLEMPIVYWLEERNYKFAPLIIGAMMIASAYICFFVFRDPLLGVIIHTILISVGEIINFPFITAICMSRANEASKGKYMGAVTMCFSMAFLISPAVGLPVVEKTGYDIYWFLILGLIIIGIVGIYSIQSKFSNKNKRPTNYIM